MKPRLTGMRPILAAVIIIFLVLGTKLQAQQKNFIDQPYLEVAGTADTLITPDQIFMHISLSEKDTRDRITVEQLERNMFDALQRIDINPERNLKVIDVVSNYRDYLLKKTDVMKSKRYELEVSTADTAAKVLAELERLGISNINIARLNHTRIKEIEQQLREQSALDALRRASGIALILNQKIGSAIHVVETPTIGGSSSFQGDLEEVVVVGYSVRGKVPNVEAKDVTFRSIKIEKTISVKFILQ